MINVVIPKTRMLYHFTATHSLKGIERQGLWKGILPWQRDPQGRPCCIRHKNETRMNATQLARLNEIEAEKEREGRLYWRPGFQWLTKNPEFAQPFCLLGNLPFPKNAYRLTVLVPESGLHRLTKWTEMCNRGHPDCEAEINTSAVDFENWWTFYGPIPRTWIVETPLRNAGQAIVAELEGKGNG
jgi:hypothetical protein